MTTISTHRMLSTALSDAEKGEVRWAPAKSLWTFGMLAVAVIGAPLTFTWDAMALFLLTTIITICAGHSVGMHRLLIHRSFESPKWLERTLLYLGTLVGMAGPFGMIAAHDIRDWAQRQDTCHDLYAHRRSFLVDCWWQMHCIVDLKNPPRFVIEPEVQNDAFYRFIDRTYMLQQLPWAVLFFMIGGLHWVVWGIAVRVTLSLHGHWLIGHFAHRRGWQGWVVDGVAVQGFNIPYASLLTFGESWHGNHHAFPGSAKLGVEHGQLDPGWWLIKTLAWIGLARDIKTPVEVGEREGLRRLDMRDRRYPKKLQLLAAWMTSIAVGVGMFIAVLGVPTRPAELFWVMGTVGLLSLLAFAFAVVPMIRYRLQSASQDLVHGYWYYVNTGFQATMNFCLVVSLVAGPGFLFLFVVLIFAIAPAALMSSLVFGWLNKRAIRRELSAYPI
jgi:sn-1 stearoyl-lipid 9-desaturase